MNPITSTTVIVVSAEVTEKPAQPTNSCSIITKPAVIVVSAEVTEKPAQPTNSCSIM
ncbi:2219_t:CDS:2 [Rhizophagus irregularis]|nr:2219_t:CDS:2 [Rhizophagus irregularis]